MSRPEDEPDATKDATTDDAWRRRKRRAEVFGDVLPETTRDERDEAGGDSGQDRWLREQVPPHHGS